MLEVEDVACSGDDMKARSFTMFLSEGMVLRRENKGSGRSGYELIGESLCAYRTVTVGVPCFLF